MRKLLLLFTFVALAPHQASFGQAQPVPKGEVTKHSFEASKVFPGTYRDYWVYVPKQYDPAKPACVFVCQDGIQYNAPAVFDKLIASGDASASRRAAHTLKGDAGMLGAQRLVRAAAELERACQRSAPATELQELLDATKREFAAFLAAIEELPPGAPALHTS